MRVLYIVSTHPALTHTFILREIQMLRTLGFELTIGQLRPLHKTPAATGFEDLEPLVCGGKWLSLDMLAGTAYFALRYPDRLLRCIWFALRTWRQPSLTGPTLFVTLAVVGLAFRLRNSGIGHVRAHFLHTEAVGSMMFAHLLGIPYSITAHTVVLHHSRSTIRRIVEEASFLVADTSEVRDFLLTLGARPPELYLIRNGVSLTEFEIHKRQVTSSPPLILAVGRLIPKKGFHVLLAACHQLLHQGVSFQLLLVGDGEERRTLEKMRQELGLEDRVKFLGYLSASELRDLYYKATVLAVPSVVSPDLDKDGLPTVIVEALAAGVPIIGSDVGGIPEVIHHGVTGLLVPPNEPGMLADGLRTLLTQAEVRNRFATEGRRFVVKEFDLHKNVEALGALLGGRDAAMGKHEVEEGFREAHCD